MPQKTKVIQKTNGPTTIQHPSLFKTILGQTYTQAMLWARHAATIGNNANSMVDKYTDNH